MTTPEPVEPPADEPQPSEPALSVGVQGTIGVAIMNALVVFAVPLSAEQRLAIVGLVTTVVPFVLAFLVRRRVFSPETVRLLLASARDQGRAAGRKEITG